jgi:hypothetical protein
MCLSPAVYQTVGRLHLKRDGTLVETRFRLLAKRTSPFKSAGASVQSNTGNRGGRISGSNAGYTMFRGSVKSTGYPLHSPVSPSLPFPCVTTCHHISTGLYKAGSWIREVESHSACQEISHLTCNMHQSATVNCFSRVSYDFSLYHLKYQCGSYHKIEAWIKVFLMW